MSVVSHIVSVCVCARRGVVTPLHVSSIDRAHLGPQTVEQHVPWDLERLLAILSTQA